MNARDKQALRLLNLSLIGIAVILAALVAKTNLCACGNAKATFSSVGQSIGSAGKPSAPAPAPAVPPPSDEKAARQLAIDAGAKEAQTP